MPTFTKDNAETWQGLFDSVAKDRPSVGKCVKVVKGKKQVGTTGLVTWHGKDKFSHAYRYGSDAQLSMRDAMGKYGFRVRIQPNGGGDEFFVSAENVEVIHTADA